MRTRHLFDIPNNDPTTPLCHNLLTGGAVVRMDRSNVNCTACLDLLERMSDRHDRELIEKFDALMQKSEEAEYIDTGDLINVAQALRDALADNLTTKNGA